MLSRRTVLLAPLAAAVTPAPAAPGKMVLSLHQNTSLNAGYRKSLEGWARAGIKHVELTDRLLDEFLKTDSLAAAQRVVKDLGLTPVSASAAIPDFCIPTQARPPSLYLSTQLSDHFSSFRIPPLS